MPSYTSQKISYNNALNLKLIFANSATDRSNTVGYVFIGKNLQYEDENNPDLIMDTGFTEREVWDNMFAAKKITENNVELVVPRFTYSNTQNVTYRQYDDTVELSELLTANASQNLMPMYVINSEGNVYKCLSNNSGAISLQEPLGDYSTNEYGNIFVLDDGYIWKYLYNVSVGNNFQTPEWIPAPTSVKNQGYNSSQSVCVDGEIITVQVTDGGSGYFHSQIKTLPFNSSCTVLTITGNTNLTNIVFGMGIEGVGIVDDTFITAVNVETKQVTISTKTFNVGGGAANTYNVFTRVVVVGDGVGLQNFDRVMCMPILSGNTIQKIQVTENGKNYNYANVLIYGTGTGATAKAIISPKFGHGFNSAKELGAKSVMISMNIGEASDSTDGGLISRATSYRQYGILLNPNKYGETGSVSRLKANSVISQTFNITLDPGPPYDLNEFVYQGVSPTNSIFSGYVNSREGTSVIKLTNVKGKPSKTALLKSASVPTGRQISGGSQNTVPWKPAEFEPYTGDIVHVENIEVIDRQNGQVENIKMIVKF